MCPNLFEQHNRAIPVLPLRPVDRVYHYAVPDDMQIRAGDIVSVPLGGGYALGIVWGDEIDADELDYNLKSIQAVTDHAHIPGRLRELIEWTASYTMASIGMVAKMAMPISSIFQQEQLVTLYKPTKDALSAKGLTTKRQSVLQHLEKTGPATAPEISDVVGVSASMVYSMEKAGLLQPVSRDERFKVKDYNIDLPKLNADQERAAQRLVQNVKDQSFQVSLLDGVTGSGKTEVYFYAIQEAIERGDQALIMVPEIALTQQFTKRFQDRFEGKPCFWHSNMSVNDRKRAYKDIASGRARVIVGARSALFLPFKSLSLIIVDEEHDHSYKQEDKVIYQGRDIAVKRGHIENCPVVLVSATPSLETHVNCMQDRYERLRLPDRHAGALMPDMKVIDMRQEKVSKTFFISPALHEAMQETLNRGEQVMLFLNRRGYAPLTLCRSCGHRIQCPNCSAWLVEHRDKRKLKCHHCSYTDWRPKTCPECDAEDSLVPIGPGVERVRDDATVLFPDHNILVLSSDTHQVQSQLLEALEDIRNKKIDIIVGTQILAKGHHFPNLTCVGVIDADLGLTGGDLRASERTYQLLHQVSGRAGRAEKKGTVYLQSYQPEHRVIQALIDHDRDKFLYTEVVERQEAKMPPFGRMAGIIISSENEKKAEQQARACVVQIPQIDGVRILGPIQAPLYKLRKNYRWRLLVITDKKINLQKVIEIWLASVQTIKNTRIQVDIDPYTFF